MPWFFLNIIFQWLKLNWKTPHQNLKNSRADARVSLVVKPSVIGWDLCHSLLASDWLPQSGCDLSLAAVLSVHTTNKLLDVPEVATFGDKLYKKKLWGKILLIYETWTKSIFIWPNVLNRIRKVALVINLHIQTIDVSTYQTRNGWGKSIFLQKLKFF